MNPHSSLPLFYIHLFFYINFSYVGDPCTSFNFPMESPSPGLFPIYMEPHMLQQSPVDILWRDPTSIQQNHGHQVTTNHWDHQQNTGHVNHASWQPSSLCGVDDTREGCEMHHARGFQRNVPGVLDGRGRDGEEAHRDEWRLLRLQVHHHPRSQRQVRHAQRATAACDSSDHCQAWFDDILIFIGFIGRIWWLGHVDWCRRRWCSCFCREECEAEAIPHESLGQFVQQIHPHMMISQLRLLPCKFER